jgi:hypothetical protein
MSLPPFAQERPVWPAVVTSDANAEQRDGAIVASEAAHKSLEALLAVDLVFCVSERQDSDAMAARASAMPLIDSVEARGSLTHDLHSN